MCNNNAYNNYYYVTTSFYTTTNWQRHKNDLSKILCQLGSWSFLTIPAFILLTDRGHNPPDGSRCHVFSFRLANQSHAQILHIEHHPFQESLLGVRPVLWELYNTK